MSVDGDSFFGVAQKSHKANRQPDRKADSLLTASLDLASIDDLDPSLEGGFKQIYDREIPCELRRAALSDGAAAGVGDLEAIRVRVFLLGGSGRPQQIKAELSNETNLFFHYTSCLTPEQFEGVQQRQGLMVDFAAFPSVLISCLDECVRQPHTHFCYLELHPDGEADLSFIQSMQHKFVELLSCKCQSASEAHLRDQVAFRYNAVKSRLALMQARLVDVHNLVKQRSPQLLMQLQGISPRMATAAEAASAPDRTDAPDRAAASRQTFGRPINRRSSSAFGLTQSWGPSLCSTMPKSANWQQGATGMRPSSCNPVWNP